MNRLALGICGGASVPFSFIKQLAVLYSQGPLLLAANQGLHIQQNRNAVVRQALDTDGWDYLLFLDPDMIFPDDMRKTAESWSDPVVGGLYFRRVWPDYRPIPGMLLGTDSPAYAPLDPETMRNVIAHPGLSPCDVLGTGCLGIRRDVLENWPDDMMPWFNTALSRDGQEMVTEDVWFCWNLKRQGVQAQLDTRVRCGHTGEITVGVNTYTSMLDKTEAR